MLRDALHLAVVLCAVLAIAIADPGGRKREEVCKVNCSYVNEAFKLDCLTTCANSLILEKAAESLRQSHAEDIITPGNNYCRVDFQYFSICIELCVLEGSSKSDIDWRGVLKEPPFTAFMMVAVVFTATLFHALHCSQFIPTLASNPKRSRVDSIGRRIRDDGHFDGGRANLMSSSCEEEGVPPLANPEMPPTPHKKPLSIPIPDMPNSSTSGGGTGARRKLHLEVLEEEESPIKKQPSRPRRPSLSAPRSRLPPTTIYTNTSARSPLELLSQEDGESNDKASSCSDVRSKASSVSTSSQVKTRSRTPNVPKPSGSLSSQLKQTVARAEESVYADFDD